MNAGDILLSLVRDFPYALIGSAVLGAACAFLGTHIVAKRVVFYSAVLTQVSVLGLALTFLPVFPVSHAIGSLGLTLISALLLSGLLTRRRLTRDAVLGVVFTGAIALRILVLQMTSTVDSAEIETLLRGDILFVTAELFYPVLGVAVVVLGLHVAFFKEFVYVSFDAETASTQGFRTAGWEMLFYATAAAVIALGTHMVGDLFVFGFMVLPAATALLVVRRVSRIFLTATVIGAFVPMLGLVVAFAADFPAGPTSLALALVLLLCAAIAARLRPQQ